MSFRSLSLSLHFHLACDFLIDTVGGRKDGWGSKEEGTLVGTQKEEKQQILIDVIYCCLAWVGKEAL